MGRQHNTPNERTTLLKAMGAITACGLDCAILVLIGVLAGNLVDGRLHSSPWGLLIGLFVGLIAGFYAAYLIIAPIVRSM